MLLGEISPQLLKTAASGLWRGPLESDAPRFHLVDIVGTIKRFHGLSVRSIFI